MVININTKVIDFLNKTYGYNISADYYRYIALWQDWWKGYHQPFHRIGFENGQKKKYKNMYTMKMAKKVCEDWASILVNDKTYVKVNHDYSQRFITGSTQNGGVFGSNNFWIMANGLMERMMWSGTAAIAIRLKNVSVGNDGRLIASPKTRIDFSYLDANHIIPLTVDNGIITEAAFCSDIYIYGNKKIYLEIHRLDGGEYIIENHIFVADKNGTDLLREDDLPKDVPPILRTGADKPWFAICEPAIVNTVSVSNGMGCAVFADAIDNLKGVDLAYNNLNSDIYLGQKKVFLNKDLMADVMGTQIAPDDVNQQLFYYLGSSVEDNARPLVQEHNPDLRISDNTSAIQAQLDYLSFKVGFGTKHYQFNAGSIVTATQYTGDKQDLIQNAHKHFIQVESFLHSLVQAILWIGHNYIDSNVKEDAQIYVVFDQSPLIDENAERLQDMQDVTNGIMTKWEYRVKWYGETEEAARSMIDEIEKGQSEDDLLGFGVDA